MELTRLDGSRRNHESYYHLDIFRVYTSEVRCHILIVHMQTFVNA